MFPFVSKTLGASEGAVRVPVLLYHRVANATEGPNTLYRVTPERFRDQLHAAANAGWQACSIHEFFAWLDGNRTLPTQSFLLTFDDGYRDLYENALPVLKELNWPCSVFLVSGRIGSVSNWSLPGAPVHPYALLSRTEIAEMARAGVSFQSHTCDHLDLTTVGVGERRLQLERAKADLEILLGSPVSYLAYPYGRFNEEVEQMVGELGYAGAFSVLPGFNRPGTARYRLRRLDVFGTDTPDQLLRKLALGSNDGSGRAIARYVMKRALQRLTVWK